MNQTNTPATVNTPAPLVVRGVTIPANMATAHNEAVATIEAAHNEAVATLKALSEQGATTWATSKGAIRTAHTATATARAPLQARVNAGAVADVARLITGNYGGWFADVAACLTAPQVKALKGQIEGEVVMVEGVAMTRQFTDVASLKGGACFALVADYLAAPYVWKTDKATKTQTREAVTFAKGGNGAKLRDLAEVARLARGVVAYRAEVAKLETATAEAAKKLTAPAPVETPATE